MSDHMDRLRAKHPDANPGVLVLVDENRELAERLSEVRGQLSALIGRYSAAGTVPVDELAKVLATARGDR